MSDAILQANYWGKGGYMEMSCLQIQFYCPKEGLHIYQFLGHCQTSANLSRNWVSGNADSAFKMRACAQHGPLCRRFFHIWSAAMPLSSSRFQFKCRLHARPNKGT